MPLTQTAIEMATQQKHVLNNITAWFFQSDHYEEAVSLITEWSTIPTYPSKDKRKALVYADYSVWLAKLLAKILMSTIKKMPMISVMAQCEGLFKFTEMSFKERMKTVGELIAVLEPLGTYQFSEGTLVEDQEDRTVFVSNIIELPDELDIGLGLCIHPLPLIKKPLMLKHNNHSGYHTLGRDSVLLGYKENHHEEYIALDVLNIQNQVAYRINPEWIEDHYPELTFENPENLDPEQKQTMQTGYEMHREEVEYVSGLFKDRDIYFTHKYDKRGRMYARAYHFNYQGDSFKKSCLEFATKEIVEGTL